MWPYLHNGGREQPRTQDLGHPDVVDIERRLLGQDGDARLGDEVGEEILVAVLLAHHRRPHSLLHLFKIPRVLWI